MVKGMGRESELKAFLQMMRFRGFICSFHIGTLCSSTSGLDFPPYANACKPLSSLPSAPLPHFLLHAAQLYLVPPRPQHL